MREERKWLRHPIVRPTAATVQQDKGLAGAVYDTFFLLNSRTSSLRSREMTVTAQKLQVSIHHIEEAPIHSFNIPPECVCVYV